MSTTPSRRATEWVAQWAAAQGHALGAPVRWRRTTSGASLGFGSDAVVKIHPARTDRPGLTTRVAAAASPRLAAWLVAPLTEAVGSLPGSGRAVTLWPRVPVLDRSDADRLPWAEIGAHLAGLHRVDAPDGLPHHGGHQRVERALARVTPQSPMLRDLGERLVAELARPGARHTGVVHGDWHLGQLARMPSGWRLLDVDDLGVGDSAWDLGRPAGFWAAGLLADEQWTGLLRGYRDARGPAVPATGDPWPALDLPARCAVFVAACRQLRRTGRSHSSRTADALVAACGRM